MIIDTVKEAYKQAMRDRDAVAKATLSTLIGEADKVAKDARIEKIDDAKLISMIKKHMDSATETANILSSRGTSNLDELKAVQILSQFMPRPLTDDELLSILQAHKDAGENKGVAMKALRENYAGRYDGAFAAKVYDTL